MTFRDSFPPPDDYIVRLEDRPQPRVELNPFIVSLLETDWDAENAPMKLTDDLSIDDVKSAVFFDQTRQFLRLIDENKGVPLTATGNLNRTFVARTMEEMDWIRRYVAPLKRYGRRKVYSEFDTQPLQIIHRVCEHRRLVRKRRARLFVTSKGRELCADAQASRLFRLLFTTFFLDFDLDSTSGYRDVPSVQNSMAVIFWRLQIVAAEWTAADRLPYEVFLTPVRDQVNAGSPDADAEVFVLRHYVLEPLTWFGLIESDLPEEERHKYLAQPKYRKTPLFDRFFRFATRP